MTTYTVIMDAIVSVTVEAKDEDEACEKARDSFRWTDVEIEDVIDVMEDS